LQKVKVIDRMKSSLKGLMIMDKICEKVIRCLLDTEGYVTTATLSDMTGISVSSIKHNLNWIRKELEQFDIQLQSTPKKGFRLNATVKERKWAFQKLEEDASKHADSFTFRKGYILDTLFQFPANYTIQLFSEELSVSRNMIQKDLEKIDQQLAKFHVSIKRVRNQGVVLVGDEFNVRQAIVEHNNSKYWKWNPDTILEILDDFDGRVSKKAYTYLTGTYPKEKLLEIQSALLEAEAALNIKLIDIAFCRVVEYIAITWMRVKGGNAILESSREEMLIDVDADYIQASQLIVNKILPRLRNINLEIKYLAARIFVNNTCGNSGKRGSGKYDETSRIYVKAIENMLGIKKLSRNNELIHEVSNTLEKITVRENYQILSWSDLHIDIREQLAALYTVCMTNSIIVESQIGTMVRQDDIAWLTLLIHNFMNRDENKVKAIFVHAANEHKVLYQKRKIEREIKEMVISECVYFEDFRIEQTEDLVIISTVPQKVKKDYVIEVTKHIDQRDMIHIKKQLEKLEENRLNEGVNELLKEVFAKELMIPELGARNKEEAIAKMGKRLMELGYVREGFCEKVLEREDFCSTAIGKGIAIPHHYKDLIHKSGIAVARLKHRIIWQKVEKVDIVFLIAINYVEQWKVQILFKYLYDIIEDEEKIEQIRSASDQKQMLKAVLQMIPPGIHES